MLLIKITSDLDIYQSRVLRMEIKSEYNESKNRLLRAMGFTFDKQSKSHVKIITNKNEARQLIKHLTKENPIYVLEFVKVMKRKRSANLNKIINNIKSNKTNNKTNMF